MSDIVRFPASSMPLSCEDEGRQTGAAAPPAIEGQEFLAISAGLFAAAPSDRPGVDSEGARPGSSLFAWRHLFRS